MPTDAVLVAVGATDRTVPAGEDVRGRVVRDCDGLVVGTVTDLLVDTAEGKVRFLQVADDPGRLSVFVPVEAVGRVGADEIQLDQTLARVTGAPRADAGAVGDRRFYRLLYGYYEYAPFWSAGHVYPPFPQQR